MASTQEQRANEFAQILYKPWQFMLTWQGREKCYQLKLLGKNQIYRAFTRAMFAAAFLSRSLVGAADNVTAGMSIRLLLKEVSHVTRFFV